MERDLIWRASQVASLAMVRLAAQTLLLGKGGVAVSFWKTGFSIRMTIFHTNSLVTAVCWNHRVGSQKMDYCSRNLYWGCQTLL